MEGNRTISDLIHASGAVDGHGWQPQVDITETTTTVLVQVNIAGVPDEEIDVDFYNNLVCVRGLRERSTLEGVSYVRSEIPCGEFERRIAIPVSVTSPESVNIKSSNGMLYIAIDKAREERNRFSINVSRSATSTQGNSSAYVHPSSGDTEDEVSSTASA